MHCKKQFYIVVVFFLFCSSLFAQNTRVLGHVKDSATGVPLPFCSIAINGTSLGTTSDFEGTFKLEFSAASDTILVSCLGYRQQSIPVKRNQFQEISINLSAENITLSEVIIVPGENPAEVMLKKVIRSKKTNSPDNADFYEVDVYNKVQIDANNISEEFKSQRALKKFGWIFEYTDTSLVNGKVYLPLFITESISKIYFRGNPKSKREFISAVQVSGVENESVAQYLGNMYQNVNIYDGFITLFDKNFMSPINDLALTSYKYYLMDSTFIDETWCYKIMFKPRRRQELTFSGEFWVADSSWAVKQFSMRVVNDANINFVNDLIIEQSFQQTDSGYWMPEKESLVIDFNVMQNDQKSTMGFYGHKTTSYRNYVLKQTKENSFFNAPERVVVADDAYEKGLAFWQQERHDTLSKDEQTIYFMVDSIKKMPTFSTVYDLVDMFVSGYLNWGKVDIGPYASMLSFNEIEGTRFRLGGRTSEKFSKRIMPSAYVAWGTKDQKFKFGGGFLYLQKKKPRRGFQILFKHDMEQLGMSPTGFREDFLLASFITRNPANKLTLVNELKAHYEHEWFTGFSNTIRFLHKDIFPVGDTVFNFGEGTTRDKITTSEITLEMRFAYKERYVYSDFIRTSLGTVYPIIQFKYSKGIKDLWGGDYNYQKASFYFNDWFNVGNIGWSKYVIEAGKIWGRLPYPFLKMHEGNETYFFDETSFNTMNYFEFVSDEWVSLYYTHRFDGFFLNRIPLLRKLKWREVVWGKGLIGNLSTANRNYSAFPEGMHTLGKPYIEAGAGIENIFKFLRVDGVWRLSYLDHPDIAKFQVMFGMQVFF